MGEEHYDVPWEFARRGRAAATRLSIATPDDVHSRSSLASPGITHTHSRNSFRYNTNTAVQDPKPIQIVKQNPMEIQLYNT